MSDNPQLARVCTIAMNDQKKESGYRVSVMIGVIKLIGGGAPANAFRNPFERLARFGILQSRNSRTALSKDPQHPKKNGMSNWLPLSRVKSWNDTSRSSQLSVPREESFIFGKTRKKENKGKMLGGEPQ